MYISIDIGGTNTRIASSKDLHDIHSDVKFSTSQDLNEEKKLISSGVAEVLEGQLLQGACIGVPGLVDKKNRRFKQIVNVPALSGLAFYEMLGVEIDPSLVFAENDASLAGLGEAVLGAGRDYEVVAYLTLSTGVGGVRIAGKQIDPYQRHSEPGHMIIQEGGLHFDLCGQNGCVSAYVSGTAFSDIYGVSPAECEDSSIWQDYAKKLSLAIINVVAMWGPDVIVFGGSMSKKFNSNFEKPLLEVLSEEPLFKIPPIVRCELGDNSGIVGGFVYLSQYLD